MDCKYESVISCGRLDALSKSSKNPYNNVKGVVPLLRNGLLCQIYEKELDNICKANLFFEREITFLVWMFGK